MAQIRAVLHGVASPDVQREQPVEPQLTQFGYDSAVT